MENREAIRHEMMKEVISRMNEGDERTEVLDAATLCAIEEGVRSEAEDPIYTWEQVKQFARERRKAWMTIPDSLSA